ncbi:MAG: hypothetical protein JEY71_06920 [Sphaerochaeta sp.]|nr:hypothetical protein [Sphaerochaeta sp.]
MITDKILGLVFPIKNPQTLADNLILYFEHPEMRIQTTKRGNAVMAKFDWNFSEEKRVNFLYSSNKIS